MSPGPLSPERTAPRGARSPVLATFLRDHQAAADLSELIAELDCIRARAERDLARLQDVLDGIAGVSHNLKAGLS